MDRINTAARRVLSALLLAAWANGAFAADHAVRVMIADQEPPVKLESQLHQFDQFPRLAQAPPPGTEHAPPAASPATGDSPRQDKPISPLLNRSDGHEPLVALSETALTLFGGLESRDLLDPKRRELTTSPGSDVVLGIEAFSRKTTDSGNLLRESSSSVGVTAQQRTPITTDTRIRAGRMGQVLASGSAWFPARFDLDTMMSKLDSQLIQDMVVIKGPYSGRYGPGFGFVDIQLVQTPRYDDGHELHGSTTLGYQTNGEQWAGRQSVWGGNESSGYYVSYGHRTGVDYRTGRGFRIPSSYNSRDVFAAIGQDLGEASRVEFNYLRLDQTDVEYPGLVFDIDALVTNGYELKYFSEEGVYSDRYFGEVWYNHTNFHGDTLKSGKVSHIPSIQTLLYSPDGMSGAAFTQVNSASLGGRSVWTWEGPGGEVTLGADFTQFKQALNDIETFLPPNDNNFPIPNSFSRDLGVFAEWTRDVSAATDLTIGARGDYIRTAAANDVIGVPLPVSDILGASLTQDFGLWSLYGYGQHRLSDSLTLSAGGAYAQRPPTLTELYALSSFIGTLQRGLTFVVGDPELDPERRIQLDLGVQSQGEYFRGGLQGFYAWVEDFITYDLFTPPDPGGGLSAGVAFVNTQLATLAGFETYGEWTLTGQLDGFANLAFIEGRDLGRADRSGVLGRNHEPLPGIPPLTSILGLRLHEAGTSPRWAYELTCRVVENQDRIAASLTELPTRGFTIWNVRAYHRVTDPLLVSFGVENFTNKHYIEHLDYRSGGIGVYRPGIGFYVGSELVY
ncbi:MAG: TonB-dependent receptor [Planctomycetales bacterium]|nr:TonB-dependent receptor [Planctomycetales bacterium]